MRFALTTLMLFMIGLSPVTEAKPAGPISSIRELLGPYPARGSAEEARDLEMLLKFQETRTEEQCRLAGLEVRANLTNFFGRHHKLLSKRELRWLKLRLFFPTVKAGVKIALGKRLFKRPRPYLTWTELTPCISREKSTAYPSGHTTLARMYARILSRIYPERAEAFMKRADEAAMYRVLGGVHHPSDIEAGKKLGDSLAHAIVKSEEFQSLLLNP